MRMSTEIIIIIIIICLKLIPQHLWQTKSLISLLNFIIASVIIKCWKQKIAIATNKPAAHKTCSKIKTNKETP